MTTLVQASVRIFSKPFKMTWLQAIRCFTDPGHQRFFLKKLVFYFTFDQNCSIGLRSGEYEGKQAQG